MHVAPKKETLILFLGDVVIFYFALWLTLFLRYGELPSGHILDMHLVPFSLIFIVWLSVFFIAGLYEKQTLVLRSKLPSMAFNALIISALLAVAFFYMVPYFNIAPKTNLFIDLVLTFGLILLWRIHGISLLGVRNRQPTVLIGSGEEMHELFEEVNNNRRYNLYFVSSVDINELDGIDFEDEVINTIYEKGVTSIVIDLKNERVAPLLPRLYNLIFSGVRFVDKYKVYEAIFDRVPLSLIGYNWFLENISSNSHVGYDFLKRVTDIVIGGIAGVVSLVVYPFVWVAIKLEDNGPLFITQERVGKDRRIIKTHKFRSMTRNELDPTKETDNKVTKVGSFIRKTRIDELPQLWSVIAGDQSLIGPRPELPSAVKFYEKEIPYYNVRHLIKPGLSGWAQMYHQEHPHHRTSVEETKNKLSYDLYYIKNRSFLLDIKIALKTARVLMSRLGK